MKQEPSWMRHGRLAPTDMKKWALLLCLSGVLGGCVSIESPDRAQQRGAGFNCAVGDVTPHEAIVWLKTTEAQTLKIQYSTDPLWGTFQETMMVPTTPETDFTTHITLTNLAPKTRYWYRSLVPGKNPGRPCQFLTAPLEEDSIAVTFVIGGDTRHSFQPFLIMETMRTMSPDFFVFLGDTIYADKETPARELSEYWDKYRENRDTFAEALLADTSVYAIWDDHEVDSDFTSTHSLLPTGRQAFFHYWPVRQLAQDSTRLYRTFRWGTGVELFLLDTRQYRNPATNSMLGEDQKQWLLAGLAASSASFKFIISSVPFSDPRVDKWGEYPEERDEILRFLTINGITGVVFLAGDVHHAAVSLMHGMTDRKEYIFGPLAAPMNDKISGQEPRFEYYQDDSPNFGKITVQPDLFKPSVHIEWFDANKTLLHHVTIEDDRDNPLTSR
ncbi:MAG TPA: alkaline phosphatase D family protein [Nitrospirales bacterium]|nr:alkaline phosphatase D family protein [Nitrospirales bacterium]